MLRLLKLVLFLCRFNLYPYRLSHKRSNVESTFGAIKKKFGDKLKSKNRVAQENELLCKLIAYNMTVVIHEMFELGIKPDFCSKSVPSAQEVGS
jgi:hypothetical protein